MGSTFIKKIAGLSAVLCLAFFTSFSQITIVDSGICQNHTLTATLTGTAPTGTGITGDDVYSGAFPIGFTFNFYGNNYTQLVIGSNGVINFDLTLAGAYCPWPITAALLGNPSMRNAICAPWVDILISSGGSITRSVSGTAPNRKYAVTWCATRQFSCTAMWVTTQIVLHETSNIVEVHTANKTICAWNGGHAITGVQNIAGTSATVAPARDWTPNWTVPPVEGWRFTPSGGTYTVASIPYAPLPYATSGLYWYNAGTGAYLGSGPSINVTVTVPTTYMVAALGCNDSTKAFITVNPVCLTPEANTPCVGDTLWVNAVGDSSGATYEWFGPAPYSTTPFATTQKAFRFPATAAMNGTYRVIRTVGAGKDTAHVNVYVHLLPVVTAASNQAICAPIVNPLNLTCTTDTICTSWNWTGPSSFTSNLQNPTVAPFDLTKQGTYYVSVVSRFGCRSSGSTLVRPGPPPILGPSGVCQYFSITLTNALATGVWSSTNPAVATIDTGGVVRGLTAGTTTVSYTLPNGCAVSTVITVHGKPTPPIVPEVRPCQFTPTGALAVTVLGAGYSTTWYGPGVTGPTNYPTGVSTIIPATDTARDTYYYYVTQTSPFGCVSDSVAFPVRVIAEPDMPSTHDTGYCQYAENVVPIVATGDSLRYYTSLTAPAFTGSFTPPIPPVTNPAVITYYVTQQQMGCESKKAALIVTIYVLPDFKITAERDWVCQFDSLKLRYDGPDYINPAFVWGLPIGSAFVNGTKFSDSTVMIRFDTAWGKHFVTLDVSNYNGRCSTQEKFEVRVIPAPNAHGYIKPNVCLGDTITLALSSHSSNAHTYNWWVDNQPIRTSNALDIVTSNINSGGPYAISFKDSGYHVIRVTGFTEEGCAADPRGDTVKVHTLPDPRYTYFIDTTPNRKFCVEDSVLFSARVKNYDYNYRWEPSHFFVNQNKPEAWGRVELTNSRVALTVTSPFGCKATYATTLKPDECCTVTMPNAFTPNGDGLNDRFRPIFDGYKRFHIFRVTNRWGHTVFESANSNPSWDGTYQGVRQDMGTYFYYLKYDCGGKAQEIKGDVTLIK